MCHVSKIHPIVLIGFADLFKKAAKHTLDGELKPGSDAFAASSANKGSADGKTDVVGNAAKGSGRSNKPPANGPKKDCRYHKGYFNRGVSSDPPFVTLQSISHADTSRTFRSDVELLQRWWVEPAMRGFGRAQAR